MTSTTQRVPAATAVPSPCATPLQGVAMFIVGAIAAIVVWGSFAPTPMHRTVPPATITAAPITGTPCAYDGGIAAAVLTDTAGPSKLYSITCRDGIVTEVAR